MAALSVYALANVPLGQCAIENGLVDTALDSCSHLVNR